MSFLFVGLGNPGSKYENTRHNLGFIMLDLVAAMLTKAKVVYKEEKKFQAAVFTSGDLTFMKPLTFMNISGDAVVPFLNFYKLGAENLIVFHDDLDLEIGQMKMKYDGGAAGQKGIQHIISVLGTNQFARIRLGIGRPADPRFEISNYVLSKLSPQELDHWQDQAVKIVQGLELWMKGDKSKAQNIINTKVKE